MIDINSEQLVPLRNVPGLLPRRPNGKAIHISAVYRWVMRGIGGVRLEAIKIGGTTYTSVEALQRFGAPPRRECTVPPSSPRDRSERAKRAHAEVERLLYPTRERGAGRDRS